MDGVSLEVPAGSFAVLLGPSGCGKSTLLRTANRLVHPDSGRVLIGDRDVATQDETQLRRGIGYVIQAVGLFPHLTVGQNVAVVPDLLGWSREKISSRVDELLLLVSLDSGRYRTRYPRELSGGEQQRVGVARAIAAEPGVLLMDEPFGAVDAIVRASLQAEIREIARRLETTILFVTHDVDEALRLADRIVVMREGRVEQYDTPLALLRNPATPYVAKLVDAQDAVRKLGLLSVRAAMAAPGKDAAASIDVEATLRDALGAFLDGASALAVTENGTAVGSLTFDAVRAALRA
ncbi:MAG: ABC transporter ATP-binding protein [Candidatus Eremiobacteraeota bacterium]|nr:ABC transporter ATP-binding protein [Candidatus Eremiobacteraeota bacterium]